MISLLLRPWRPSDAADLCLLYQSSPDLGTQFNQALPDQNSAERFIQTSLTFDPDVACNFAIELNGMAVGNVGTSNPASCKVALGSGFLAEGVERSKLQYGDERYDVETHARLRTDPTPAVELLPVQLY